MARRFRRYRRYRSRRRFSAIRAIRRLWYSLPARLSRRVARALMRRAMHTGLSLAWYGVLGFARWMSRGWH